MDGQHFDDLARALAGGISRRGMLKGLASGTAASVLGARGVRGAAAACRRPGVLCARDNQCCSGSCDPDSHRCACPADLMACGGDCVDTTTDPRNCGACDVTCPHGTPCLDGTCGCPDGQTLCDHGCVDTQTDPQNCGDCGNVCSHGEGCAAGVCTCPDGQTACDHGCVDLATDPTNCGTCGNVCPHGTTCETGTCACPAGQTLCGHGCVDLATDPRNCGACDLTCLRPPHGIATCADGSCDAACNPGFTFLNGDCCPDARVCGNACLDSPCDGRACQVCDSDSGTCVPAADNTTCGDGRACCGGTCVQLTADDHCGACDVVCLDLQRCVEGECRCPHGQTFCNDRFCTDTNTDPNHCGGCGNTCLTVAHGSVGCEAGRCRIACDAGYKRCGAGCIPDGECCGETCDHVCPAAGCIGDYTGTSCCAPDASVCCRPGGCCRNDQQCCANAVTGEKYCLPKGKVCCTGPDGVDAYCEAGFFCGFDGFCYVDPGPRTTNQPGVPPIPVTSAASITFA